MSKLSPDKVVTLVDILFQRFLHTPVSQLEFSEQFRFLAILSQSLSLGQLAATIHAPMLGPF